MLDYLPASLNSVCFTGHRILSTDEQRSLKHKLEYLLTELIINHATLSFHAGGALGFDTLAAEVVLSLRSKHKDIKLNLIIPCECQNKGWNESQCRIYNTIIENADNVRILSPYYYNGCMQTRNRELLLSSDLCIAYLRNGTAKGGTLNTVLQAAKMNIPVINLAQFESEVY